jgi:hypothetical protein
MQCDQMGVAYRDSGVRKQARHSFTTANHNPDYAE